MTWRFGMTCTFLPDDGVALPDETAAPA